MSLIKYNLISVPHNLLKEVNFDEFIFGLLRAGIKYVFDATIVRNGWILRHIVMGQMGWYIVEVLITSEFYLFLHVFMLNMLFIPDNC